MEALFTRVLLLVPFVIHTGNILTTLTTLTALASLMKVRSTVKTFVAGMPESLLLAAELVLLTLWECFGYVDVARRAKKKSKITSLAR